MSEPRSKNRIRVRIFERGWDEWDFKMLLDHPMETGGRIDRRTNLPMPADYIDVLQIFLDDRPQIEYRLSGFISRNPYFHFTFATPPREGQRMRIRWLDNRQRETVYEFVLHSSGQGSGFSFNHDAPGENVPALTPDPKPLCDSVVPQKKAQ